MKRILARRGAHLLLTSILALVMMTLSSVHAFAAEKGTSPALSSSNATYLALGDSVAFGYQPDGDFTHGYADVLAQAFHRQIGTTYINLACPGESSATLINGGCPSPDARKYPYQGNQLDAAVTYIQQHPGQVRLVTLQVGANDLLPLINPQNCQTNDAQFPVVLQQVQQNVTTTLNRLRAALTVNGKPSAQILLLNYYQPLQNFCPNSVPLTQELNATLAGTLNSQERVVDVFTAFGGATVPNEKLCTYTWICSDKVDIHPTDLGHRVIAWTVVRTLFDIYR